MSKTKVIITTLVGVLGLSGLTTASVSAATAGWMVNGTLLSGSAALATTAKVDEVIEMKSSSADVEIECTGSTLNSVAPEITSPSTGQAATLEFTSCKALTPGCTLSSSAIDTVPVTLEATLEGASAVVATFKPKTKSTFATFEFTGSKCNAEGLGAITGTARVLAPTGQDEGTVSQVNSIVTEASDELKAAGNGVGLTGSTLLKLASSEPWSFL